MAQDTIPTCIFCDSSSEEKCYQVSLGELVACKTSKMLFWGHNSVISQTWKIQKKAKVISSQGIAAFHWTISVKWQICIWIMRQLQRWGIYIYVLSVCTMVTKNYQWKIIVKPIQILKDPKAVACRILIFHSLIFPKNSTGIFCPVITLPL